MPSNLHGRFTRISDAVVADRQVERILSTQGPDVVAIDPTSPAGKRALRGVPVAGGACGTSPGTDPLHALLEKERTR